MALPDLPPSIVGGASDNGRGANRAAIVLRFDLDGMSVSDLLALRAEIDERLPVKDLADVDLNRELVLQMLQTQRLQSDVLEEDDTPANQRAQVANAVAQILTHLIKLQSEVYTSERLKRIETYLIETLEDLPADAQAAFVRRYEAGEGKPLKGR